MGKVQRFGSISRVKPEKLEYYKYTGDDYEADMAKMAADPETQRWWDECIPCLDPYTEDGPWLDMERVYRLD